jgi:hypothetical protein
MEEKVVNRRKPTSVRAVRVSDSGEWKFSSGSEDESTLGHEHTISSNDSINKLRQLENQTIQNMGELIEKNEAVIKSVKHFLFFF